MPFLVENNVRARARARANRRGMTVDGALRAEARQERDRYDVFLSQTIHDREIVFGGYTILTEDLKLTVFCDWIEAPEADRSRVTPENARYVRDRMDRSATLLFVDSSSADQSRWMCWELGWFDGAKGKVGILPVLKNADDPYRGREFLGLYPAVEADGVHKLMAKMPEDEIRRRMRQGQVMGLATRIPLSAWTGLPSDARPSSPMAYRTGRIL